MLTIADYQWNRVWPGNEVGPGNKVGPENQVGPEKQVEPKNHLGTGSKAVPPFSISEIYRTY